MYSMNSFILNSLGLLCLLQYLTSYTRALDMLIRIQSERYIREVIRTNGECLLFFHPPTLDAGKWVVLILLPREMGAMNDFSDWEQKKSGCSSSEDEKRILFSSDTSLRGIPATYLNYRWDAILFLTTDQSSTRAFLIGWRTNFQSILSRYPLEGEQQYF